MACWISDARHAEFPDPAVRFGYFDPLDRLRLVGSVEQSRPYAWPVLTQVDLGVMPGKIHWVLPCTRAQAALAHIQAYE